MAQFETYYDRADRRLRPLLYTWDDTNDSVGNWDSANTWHNWLNETIVSTPGTPDITFRTQIIDYGRIADVNPLCEVVATGSVSVNVYVADQIDSSSQLPGAPQVVGGQSQDIEGVRGRFFQYEINVEGTNPSISLVQTTLNGNTQTEYIQGDSATHGGTQSSRIAPITKSYSRVTNMTGSVQYDGTGFDSAGYPDNPLYVEADYVTDGYVETETPSLDPSEVPLVVIRSLANREEPRYAVFSSNGAQGDAYVYLTVAGLPAIRSTELGNIVEV